MDLDLFFYRAIRQAALAYPAVIPLLRGRARWAVYSGGKIKVVGISSDTLNLWIGDSHEQKTYDYFLSELSRMVRNVYEGNLGGSFIDIMANLLDGQINQAFSKAWQDEGGDGEMPQYLTDAAEETILYQYDFVDQFYRDIVDARVDGTPIDPLLARCPLWANRYTEAYNQAVALITIESGGRLIWQLGATEKHCETCAKLNNIVAFASEWEQLGVKPQNAPNDLLECGGWRCDCSLSPTDQRRSPKAFDTIMNIITSGQ